jgi:hypothetical protein
MRSHVLCSTSCLALLAAILTLPSGGAAVLPLAIEDLSRAATIVVKARVRAADCTWRYDARGQSLVTDFEITVEDAVKGAVRPGAKLMVECEGGTIGELRVRSCEEAQLEVGEEVVLFLMPHPTAAGRMKVYGWFQGKLSIVGGMVRESVSTTYAGLRARIVEAARTK